ncbi:MAG TPA: hypothetical protein VHF05_00590 [Candidatus Paceibacterota bacterium]|nr:hypothetical protein [Candidatus Paceibacterota bacterium]
MENNNLDLLRLKVWLVGANILFEAREYMNTLARTVDGVDEMIDLIPFGMVKERILIMFVILFDRRRTLEFDQICRLCEEGHDLISRFSLNDSGFNIMLREFHSLISDSFVELDRKRNQAAIVELALKAMRDAPAVCFAEASDWILKAKKEIQTEVTIKNIVSAFERAHRPIPEELTAYFAELIRTKFGLSGLDTIACDIQSLRSQAVEMFARRCKTDPIGMLMSCHTEHPRCTALLAAGLSLRVHEIPISPELGAAAGASV